MAAVPDSYGPGPHEINNNLINAVHHAIAVHPSAEAKANYAAILQRLTAQQAKAHAAHNAAVSSGHSVNPRGPGGPQDAGDYGNGQYIDQNLNPLVSAMIAAGGLNNIRPEPPVLPQAEGGLLGAVLAAHGVTPVQHVALPPWAA